MYLNNLSNHIATGYKNCSSSAFDLWPGYALIIVHHNLYLFIRTGCNAIYLVLRFSMTLLPIHVHTILLLTFPLAGEGKGLGNIAWKSPHSSGEV